jgi:hypothetical protein
MLPVSTKRRFAARSAGWSLPPGFTTAIGVLPKLNRRRRDLSHEKSEVAGCTYYADRDGSERPEDPEVRSENTDADAAGDRSHPAEPVHDSVIPLHSAPEQIKMQERRRRRRKPFPKTPVPTFVMISPGRYIRAEEPAPSVATTAGADQDNAAPRTLDPAEDITIRAAASIPEVGNGPAKGAFGSPRSSDIDPASVTEIEDSLVNEPSCNEETVDGSGEGRQSEADRLSTTISRSRITVASGGCPDPGGTLPDDRDSRLTQSQRPEQERGIGDVPDQGVAEEGQRHLVAEP